MQVYYTIYYIFFQRDAAKMPLFFTQIYGRQKAPYSSKELLPLTERNFHEKSKCTNRGAKLVWRIPFKKNAMYRLHLHYTTISYSFQQGNVKLPLFFTLFFLFGYKSRTFVPFFYCRMRKKMDKRHSRRRVWGGKHRMFHPIVGI